MHILQDLKLQFDGSDLDELLSAFHQATGHVKKHSIILLNEGGNILTWNEGVEKLKGYKAEEIIGQHIGIFYLPMDRQNGLPDKILNEAKRKGTASFTGKRIRKNGTIFFGEIQVTAIKNHEGKLIGFTKMVSEIKTSE